MFNEYADEISLGIEAIPIYRHQRPHQSPLEINYVKIEKYSVGICPSFIDCLRVGPSYSQSG
jgi:hypothetical protein